MVFIIEKDQYIVTATTRCAVRAENGKVASKIWFRTPASSLDKAIIENLVSIQLETKSRDQGWVANPGGDSWSWFDVVVLESPEATGIKVMGGMRLVWTTHKNNLGEEEDTKQAGPVLLGRHGIFAGLEAGNALGVRVCARFLGWANHASEARLILHVPQRATDSPVLRHRPRWLPGILLKDYIGLLSKHITSLTEAFDAYLDAATPVEAPAAYSLVREMLPTSPLRADQIAATRERPLRLLSFDGGGVRGISSLYILQAMMAKLSPHDPHVKPCKYFDMMCGTSTGGLIALMLGRLQMSIPECIGAYESLASYIFSASLDQRIMNFTTTGAYHKADDFEKALKKIIKEKTGDENASMLDVDPSNKCKVFVVSSFSHNLSARAEHFRTYRTRFPDAFAGCPIWEAARATSAAPTYLPPITIKGVEFVDGGVSFNNPSLLLMGEINAVFGTARRIDCLTSIGTGIQPKSTVDHKPHDPMEAVSYAKSIFEASTKIMTDCETTDKLMKELFCGRENVYYRFNVEVKVGDDWAPMITLDNHQDMHKLVDLTKEYLIGQAHRIEEWLRR